MVKPSLPLPYQLTLHHILAAYCFIFNIAGEVLVYRLEIGNESCGEIDVYSVLELEPLLTVPLGTKPFMQVTAVFSMEILFILALEKTGVCRIGYVELSHTKMNTILDKK